MFDGKFLSLLEDKNFFNYVKSKEYNVALENIFGYWFQKAPDFLNLATLYVYPYSNEQLNKSLEDIDLAGKRVLTVGSSGEQLLTSVYKGAREVTQIDGNPFAQAFTELKIAGIKNLTRQEFIDYFKDMKIFDYKYYSKISHDLSDDSKVIFDTILLNAPNESTLDSIRKIIIPDNAEMYSLNEMMKNEYYMSDENYLILREKLSKAKLSFICAPFEEFHNKATGKYDLIMLSNIKGYVGAFDFFDEVAKLSKNHLSDKGNMQVHYAFNEDDISEFEHDNEVYFEYAKTSEDDDVLEYIKGKHNLTYKGLYNDEASIFITKGMGE